MEETTQGGLSAMVIYAIAIILLISMLAKEASQVDNTTKTTACANDLTGAGSVVRLRNCWDTLCRPGPKFGYLSEGSKSWLLVKGKVVQKAQSVFKDTNTKLLQRVIDL